MFPPLYITHCVSFTVHYTLCFLHCTLHIVFPPLYITAQNVSLKSIYYFNYRLPQPQPFCFYLSLPIISLCNRKHFVKEKLSVETSCTGKVKCGNILYRKSLAWKHLVQEKLSVETSCTGKVKRGNILYRKSLAWKILYRKSLAWKHFVQEKLSVETSCTGNV